MRRYLALLLFVAFALRALAPDMASAASGASAHCHMQAGHALAPDTDEGSAPAGGSGHDHASCPLCHLTWATASNLGAPAIARRIPHILAVARPPASQYVAAFDLNRSASPRAPPLRFS